MAFADNTDRQHTAADAFINGLAGDVPNSNRKQLSTGLFQLDAVNKDELEPAPIRPEWILDGAPQAKCKMLARHTRGWGSMCHWSCTAGRFRWHYEWEESVVFVEGEVKITDANGVVYKGEPGASLFFPAGTTAIWEVPTYIRKIAFNDKPVPKVLHIQSRLMERFKGLFKK